MRKTILVILLLLCGASSLHGQIADSTSLRGQQGKPAMVTGSIMAISGAAPVLVGGGIMLFATQRMKSYNDSEARDNWAGPMIYMFGGALALVGGAVMLAAVPVFMSGYAKMQCDVPWREARYNHRGMGVILEGEYFNPSCVQVRSSLGYHFNSHIFLGAGLAPGFWLTKKHFGSDLPTFSLPIYADFRWSMLNRTVSPYLGLSAGMETIGFSFYNGGELGVRIRTGSNSTRSFWFALSAEEAGRYIRGGIKMGYSF